MDAGLADEVHSTVGEFADLLPPAELPPALSQGELEPAPEEEPVEPPLTPGKKGKKPKLTKAEKREKKRLEMIQFQKRELTANLKKELELSKLSTKRGKEEWEEMCREIKILEMQEEVVEWGEKTARIMQQKDQLATVLLEGMGLAAEMHRHQHAKHVQLLDHLANAYKQVLESIKIMQSDYASELIQYFHIELDEFEAIEKEMKQAIQDTAFCACLITEHKMLYDCDMHVKRVDFGVCCEITRRYALRDRIALKIAKTHEQFEAFLDATLDTSLDKEKFIVAEDLMKRQRSFATESALLNSTEFKLTRLLTDLQRDSVHLELEGQRRITEVKLELAYFLTIRKTLEEEMQKQRNLVVQKMAVAASEAYDLLKLLSAIESKGEMMLSTTAAMRNLQTESEKTVAFRQIDFHDLPDPEEAFEVKAGDVKRLLDISAEDIHLIIKSMKNFWRRECITEHQVMLLRQDKIRLKRENKKYTDFIKTLGVAVPRNLEKAIQCTAALPDNDPCPPCYFDDDGDPKMKRPRRKQRGQEKRLSTIESKGEMMFSTTAAMRNLQTESEKTVAFREIDFHDLPDPEEAFEVKAGDVKRLLDISPEDIHLIIKSMKNFWRRECITEHLVMPLRQDRTVVVTAETKKISANMRCGTESTA